MERKILIVIGPQGSGNHVWSKILSLPENVYGWNHTDYWMAHKYEPFNEVWAEKKPLLFPEDYNYFVTSCSLPFVNNGKHIMPDVISFVRSCQSNEVEPIVCALTRDLSILKSQQQRVRGEETYKKALQEIKWLSTFFPIHFLSYESLILWKDVYLKYLSKLLEFPINYGRLDEIDDILKINSNEKYVQDPGPQLLDENVKHTYTL